jgi:uncharacterized protein (DUF4415 family)
MPNTKTTRIKLSPFTVDSPEWTAERQARSVPFVERFPHLAGEAVAAQAQRRRGERGPQKLPTKQPVTVRLSPEVLTALRATGRGWQGKMDEVLRSWAKRQPKTASK